MAKPGVNKFRYDPYKNFTFRVKWNDRYVAGIAKVSGLASSRKGVPSRGRHVPTPQDDGPIMLERGLSDDLEFQQWAKKSADSAHRPGAGNPPDDFRKEMLIELRNQDGQLVMAYNVHRCWVSKFITMPGVSENEAVIERIELQHEGWEQDSSVAEPDGPNFREPGS
jgi:phage tail-like protein